MRACGPSTRSAHVVSGSRTQGLSVSAQEHKGCAPPTGLCGGYHVYPYGEGLSLSRGRNRLAQPQGACPPGSTLPSASKPLRKPLPATVRRRYSTPTRERILLGQAFTDALKAHGVLISMDGKGRWPGGRVRGASLAQPQAGRSLSARIRDGGPGKEAHRRLPALLQRRALPLGT